MAPRKDPPHELFTRAQGFSKALPPKEEKRGFHGHSGSDNEKHKLPTLALPCFYSNVKPVFLRAYVVPTLFLRSGDKQPPHVTRCLHHT